MSFRKVKKELLEIIDEGLKSYPVPYSKGNSIRIGAFIIRTSKHGHLIYDCQENKKVAHCFSKRGAIAIAKNLAEGNNIVNEVQKLDNDLSKHYNDAIFYQHGMKSTKDELRKEILETRYDISIYKVDSCKHQLDKFIY